jgi:hypothetical protein
MEFWKGIRGYDAKEDIQCTSIYFHIFSSVVHAGWGHTVGHEIIGVFESGMLPAITDTMIASFDLKLATNNYWQECIEVSSITVKEPLYISNIHVYVMMTGKTNANINIYNFF